MSDSSRLAALRRFSSRGRVAGSSEVTARLHIISWWYRMPGSVRLLLLAASIGASAGVGYISGYSPINAALIAAGAILALGALLLTPQLLLVGLVFFLTAPFFIPLGAVYTSQPNLPNGDPVGGAIAITVAYGIGLWIAVRWSRGRVWVTASLMSGALLFLAPMILFVFPGLGLNAARISLALILLWRCGGASWLFGAIGLAWTRLKHRSHLDEAEGYAAADPGDVSAAWKRCAAVERETADIFSNIPKPYKVFHDVTLGKKNIRVGHVAVGPGGVTLIASVHAIGPVEDSARSGIIVPGVNLDETIANLIGAKRQAAKTLRVHPRNIDILIVVHGQDAYLTERMRIAVHNVKAPGKAVENIVLVPGEQLVAEITSPLVAWSSIKVQQTIKRAQMKLRPAVLPIVQTKDKDSLQNKDLSITRLDADGHVVDLADGKASSAPGVLVIGTLVDVETTLGPLRGLRVLSTPVINTEGERVIYVCSDEEYLSASLANREPEGHSFPVGSVRIAESQSR